MEQDEAARSARALGLADLDARFPGELKRALEAAQNLSQRLPKDIHWTEEPAHVLSLAPRQGGRP